MKFGCSDGNEISEKSLGISSNNEKKQFDKIAFDYKNNEIINYFKKMFNQESNKSRNNNLDKNVEGISNLSDNHGMKERIYSNEIDESADNDILFDAKYSENSIQNKEDFNKIRNHKEMIEKQEYPDSNNDTKNNAQFGTLFEQVEGELKKRGYEN